MARRLGRSRSGGSSATNRGAIGCAGAARKYVGPHVGIAHITGRGIHECGELQIADLSISVGVCSAEQARAHHVTEDARLDLRPLEGLALGLDQFE